MESEVFKEENEDLDMVKKKRVKKKAKKPKKKKSTKIVRTKYGGSVKRRSSRRR